MAKHDDYNWIDDPFDEKKNAKLQQKARRNTALSAVVFVVLVMVVILGFFSLFTFAGLYAGA